MKSKNALYLICTLFLVLALNVSCANINATSVREASKVIVSGQSSIELEADMAKFNIQISEIADTTIEALEKTNTKISQTLNILEKHRIEKESIKTADYNISTQYSWTDGKQNRVGERVTQSLKVTVKNLKTLAPLIDSLSSVSEISINSLTFDVADKTNALSEARELAYLDALEKAKVYCESSGMHIVRPLTINESYSTYNPRSVSEDAVMNGAISMKSAALTAATELPAGGVNVQVNLQCEFEIK